MKLKVIITHYDKAISPRYATIEGNTDKELIYSLYNETDELFLYVLGDDHPLIKATFHDMIPINEAIPLINYETLDEFKCAMDECGYTLRIV